MENAIKSFNDLQTAVDGLPHWGQVQKGFFVKEINISVYEIGNTMSKAITTRRMVDGESIPCHGEPILCHDTPYSVTGKELCDQYDFVHSLIQIEDQIETHAYNEAALEVKLYSDAKTIQEIKSKEYFYRERQRPTKTEDEKTISNTPQTSLSLVKDLGPYTILQLKDEDNPFLRDFIDSNNVHSCGIYLKERWVFAHQIMKEVAKLYLKYFRKTLVGKEIRALEGYAEEKKTILISDFYKKTLQLYPVVGYERPIDYLRG